MKKYILMSALLGGFLLNDCLGDDPQSNEQLNHQTQNILLDQNQSSKKANEYSNLLGNGYVDIFTNDTISNDNLDIFSKLFTWTE